MNRLLSTIAAVVTAATVHAQAPAKPDSTFTRREQLIRMRDGVDLFTVILTPKRAAAGPLPIILSRTPYGTNGWGGTSGIEYGFSDLIADGYIFVFQDIRGRFKSKGSFVMNRPPCAVRNAQCVDESSDTYDTIEWLTKHLPNNNGRVGQLGISYPGWLTNVAAIGAHPALKALSPQATMGDTWMGDDFFHQGASRQSYTLEYSWSMEASTDQSITPAPGRFDTYDWYRSFPTLRDLTKAVGADKWPTWARVMAHPSYDAEWTTRALPKVLTHSNVPTLTVGGFWDQEDLYGPQASYRALEKTDSAKRNHIVIGPWYHGEWFLEAGDSLGNARFGSATGAYFRKEIEAKWFAYWLKSKGDGRFPEATVFDAGAGKWRSYDAWPPKGAAKQLYFHANGVLSFDAPTETAAVDSFVSDPKFPVPYRPRPIEWTYDARGSRWQRWMTEDQRFVHGRPDVLAWETAALTADITLGGDITAHLFASTTGSDADWVVKLIDVYPDSIKERPSVGGYQLMIAGDIMRGRYQSGWTTPKAIPSNTVVPFTVDMHQQAYTFRKGHRIMVQVQSLWFPLYDRNPQTFVPNIFDARATDYRAQTHRVMRTRAQASHVAVTVLQ